jgi:hypothetical protein
MSLSHAEGLPVATGMMPSSGRPALAPTQLARSQLRHAWECLSQVADNLDTIPAEARPYVATALAWLVKATALVEDTVPMKEP